jgi:hypothetical protein
MGKRCAGNNTELTLLGNGARKSPAGNGYAHAALDDPRMCHDLGIPSGRRETRDRRGLGAAKPVNCFEQLAQKIRRQPTLAQSRGRSQDGKFFSTFFVLCFKPSELH